jgi:hypothetical protein
MQDIDDAQPGGRPGLVVPPGLTTTNPQSNSKPEWPIDNSPVNSAGDESYSRQLAHLILTVATLLGVGGSWW